MTPPAAAAPAKRVPTGVKRLDSLLGGGLPPGCAALLYGPPFLGKETLARRFALSNILAGRPAVTVLTNAAAADVRRLMARGDKGYPALEAKGMARFVDTYSRGIGAADTSPLVEYLDSALDLNGLSLAINKVEAALVAQHPEHALVLDSVSTLVAYSNPATAFRFLQTLIGRTRRAGATTLILMDHGMHSEADVQMFKHLMNGAIELREAHGKTQMLVQGLGATSSPGWVDYSFDDVNFEVTGSFAAGRIR